MDLSSAIVLITVSLFCIFLYWKLSKAQEYIRDMEAAKQNLKCANDRLQRDKMRTDNAIRQLQAEYDKLQKAVLELMNTRERK